MAPRVAVTQRVAQVVEAGLSPEGRPVVYRVSCAIDCGRVINPGIVAAQAEGSIVWGLTAALLNQVTIAGGAPVPRHFGDYPIMRLSDMPEIRLHIAASHDRPEGIGEPCVVPVAPALVAACTRPTQCPRVLKHWA